MPDAHRLQMDRRHHLPIRRRAYPLGQAVGGGLRTQVPASHVRRAHVGEDQLGGLPRFLPAARESQRRQDEALRLWAQAGVSYGAWKQELEATPLLVQESPFFDASLTSHYKASAAAALRLKLIRRPIDVDAWIDRRFLAAAVKELGLEGFWPTSDSQGRPAGGQM